MKCVCVMPSSSPVEQESEGESFECGFPLCVYMDKDAPPGGVMISHYPPLMNSGWQ